MIGAYVVVYSVENDYWVRDRNLGWIPGKQSAVLVQYIVDRTEVNLATPSLNLTFCLLDNKK